MGEQVGERGGYGVGWDVTSWDGYLPIFGTDVRPDIGDDQTLISFLLKLQYMASAVIFVCVQLPGLLPKVRIIHPFPGSQ